MFRLGDAYLTLGINFILVLLAQGFSTQTVCTLEFMGGNLYRMQIYFQIKMPTDKNQIYHTTAAASSDTI